MWPRFKGPYSFVRRAHFTYRIESGHGKRRGSFHWFNWVLRRDCLSDRCPHPQASPPLFSLVFSLPACGCGLDLKGHIHLCGARISHIELNLATGKGADHIYVYTQYIYVYMYMYIHTYIYIYMYVYDIIIFAGEIHHFCSRSILRPLDAVPPPDRRGFPHFSEHFGWMFLALNSRVVYIYIHIDAIMDRICIYYIYI
jgi:hypothetical protein